MMNTSKPPAFWSVRGLLGATAVGLLLTSSQAMAADPIKFGVIAEAQAIACNPAERTTPHDAPE